MNTEGTYHVPVLLNEAVEALHIEPSGVYVDCTFGGGGHSRAILEKLGPDGKLVAFDQDRDAEVNVPRDSRVLFIPHNFRYLYKFLRLHELLPVNGVLADLGVSSFQIDHAQRGFSTRYDGLLDMRMDQRTEYTAKDVLHSMDAKELQLIFQNYGEVTNAKTLAERIVEHRKTKPLETLNDLNAILSQLSKGNPNRYYAQVYQALRIEVNHELDSLKEMLEQLPKVLGTGGRAAIITFHSLEDRIVKNFFKYGNHLGRRVTDEFGRSAPTQLKIITKKPVTPRDEELKTNPRSRSAKLRVVEKN